MFHGVFLTGLLALAVVHGSQDACGGLPAASVQVCGFPYISEVW